MRQITVGIPVFNAMPYLPESLESILQQTYDDFEILVINDGSTDDSGKYLRSIHDPRLRILEQENRGVTATRNRMLAETTTPWLALHDADDVAFPHRMARAAEYISRYPESGMFYSMAEYYASASAGRLRTTKSSPAEIKKLVQSGYLPDICNSTAIHHVERTLAVGGYRLYTGDDCDLWWRVALQYDVRFIPDVLTKYRHNLQSLTSSNIEEWALVSVYVQYLLISHLWKKEPLEFEEIRGALQMSFSKRAQYMKHKRAFIVELGRGNKHKAFLEAARTFFASPKDCVQRLLDGLFPERTIAMGEPPAQFKKNESILWPSRP